VDLDVVQPMRVIFRVEVRTSAACCSIRLSGCKDLTNNKLIWSGLLFVSAPECQDILLEAYIGTFVRSYMVRIVRNVHARVMETENSISFTAMGMELRTFCMVSVYCCTGHRPLLTCNPYMAHCLVLLYHSHI